MQRKEVLHYKQKEKSAMKAFLGSTFLCLQTLTHTKKCEQDNENENLVITFFTNAKLHFLL